MNNTMTIKGYTAVISFDPDKAQFRGEFIGLNGASVDALRKEGTRSLQTFLDVCKEHPIEPHKNFSGKFVVRVPAPLHARVSEAAAAAGVSLNQWVQSALEREVHA